MPDLPTLFHMFDTATRQQHSMLDHAGRRHGQGTGECVLNSRPILWMDQFQEFLVGDGKCVRIRFEDAVSLGRPGYRKRRQVGFPIADFCYTLSSQQQRSLDLQLLRKLALFGLALLQRLQRRLARTDIFEYRNEMPAVVAVGGY